MSLPPFPSPTRESAGSGTPWRLIRRLTALAALAVFAAFWTWALFFASKEPINRFDDRQWAARAEAICVEAAERRGDLADYRRLDGSDPAMLAERATLVDTATDTIEDALDRLTATMPTDAKGAELVPQWEADYRVYIANRRDYADELRDGLDQPFREARSENIPISERLEVFAADNSMPTCAPPRDL